VTFSLVICIMPGSQEQHNLTTLTEPGACLHRAAQEAIEKSGTLGEGGSFNANSALSPCDKDSIGPFPGGRAATPLHWITEKLNEMAQEHTSAVQSSSQGRGEIITLLA
jgi:hypothetical protein